MKIVKVIVNLVYKTKCIIDEKKTLKKCDVKLNKIEKEKIEKGNYSVCKIMKNTYDDFEQSDYQYFVSDDFYQCKMLPLLNDVNYNIFGMRHKYSYFMDKNYQEKIVECFKFPNVVIRKINNEFYDSNYNYITAKEALSKVIKYEKLVFKKSLGYGHGKGVVLVEKKHFASLLDNFSNNFVVQDIVVQHSELAKFNSTSVNIIRITSLYLKGHVYILGSILRIGPPGSFCDLVNSKDETPRIVAIDNNGNIHGPAISPVTCKKYSNIYGKTINGKIPFYEKIIESIKEQHKKFIHHRIIGWDITIDNNNNIICMEFNSLVPGIIQTQMVCGPIFSQLSNNNLPLYDEIINIDKN